MALFFKQSCVAITWSRQGFCHAIHLEKVKNEFVVVSHWQNATAVEAHELSSLIAKAVAAVNPVDDSVTLAGPVEGTSFVDLVMPKLAPENLASALKFEVAKQSPLPEDDVVWGYRVIGECGENQQTIRLIILPKTVWEHWLNAAGGIATGIEMLIPAEMGLDPVLTGKDIVFGNDPDAKLLSRSVGDCGREIVQLDSEETADIVGYCPNPLCFEETQLGALGELPESEQQLFASAMALAQYGLSKSFNKDQRTLMRIPVSMQPKRKLSFILLNTVLVCYFIMICLWWFAGNYRADSHEQRVLNNEVETLKRKINSIKDFSKDIEHLKSIRSQLLDTTVDRPGVEDCLAILTEIIDPKTGIYVSSFNWDGKVFNLTFTAPDDIAIAEVEAPIKKCNYFDSSTLQLGPSINNRLSITVAPMTHSLAETPKKPKKGNK